MAYRYCERVHVIFLVINPAFTRSGRARLNLRGICGDVAASCGFLRRGKKI